MNVAQALGELEVDVTLQPALEGRDDLGAGEPDAALGERVEALLALLERELDGRCASGSNPAGGSAPG